MIQCRSESQEYQKSKLNEASGFTIMFASRFFLFKNLSTAFTLIQKLQLKSFFNCNVQSIKKIFTAYFNKT